MESNGGIFPPWDSRWVSFREWDSCTPYGNWGQGPSGVQWNVHGIDHPPSAWDALVKDVDMDIDWIKQQLETYQKALPERDDTKVCIGGSGT